MKIELIDVTCCLAQVVYLDQEVDPVLRERAQWAADTPKQPLEIRQVDYRLLEDRLVAPMEGD